MCLSTLKPCAHPTLAKSDSRKWVCTLLKSQQCGSVIECCWTGTFSCYVKNPSEVIHYSPWYWTTMYHKWNVTKIVLNVCLFPDPTPRHSSLILILYILNYLNTFFKVMLHLSLYHLCSYFSLSLSAHCQHDALGTLSYPLSFQHELRGRRT